MVEVVEEAGRQRIGRKWMLKKTVGRSFNVLEILIFLENTARTVNFRYNECGRKSLNQHFREIVLVKRGNLFGTLPFTDLVF